MSKASTRMASSLLTSQWASQQVLFSMECSAFSLGSSLRDCSIPMNSMIVSVVSFAACLQSFKLTDDTADAHIIADT